MTEPAISIAFFDTAQQLYGSARGGATLLFEGSRATVLAEGPRLDASGEGLHAELPERLSLDFEPAAPPAELGSVRARVCTVVGQVVGRRVECLGTVAETREAPAWVDLELLRTISVLVDAEHAFLALARRPQGAAGHGDERVLAWVLEGAEQHAVEEARISTVYDPHGRQRSAGLEIWLPGDEFPRRGSGSAVAGSSLELEGLHVHAAIFRWRLEGREGVGAYELMLRSEPPRAA